MYPAFVCFEVMLFLRICVHFCKLICPYLGHFLTTERQTYSSISKRNEGSEGGSAALPPTTYQWRIKLFVHDRVNTRVKEKQKASLSVSPAQKKHKSSADSLSEWDSLINHCTGLEQSYH